MFTNKIPKAVKIHFDIGHRLGKLPIAVLNYRKSFRGFIVWIRTDAMLQFIQMARRTVKDKLKKCAQQNVRPCTLLIALASTLECIQTFCVNRRVYVHNDNLGASADVK